MTQLAQSARYVPRPPPATHKLVLFDVMDTLIADPFFRGFEKDLFGLEGGIKSLFAIKDQKSFIAFEKGEINEDLHFMSYFTDRRLVDGDKVVNYMKSRYEWLPGMKQLCTELQSAGVEMAACSNCALFAASNADSLHVLAVGCKFRALPLWVNRFPLYPRAGATTDPAPWAPHVEEATQLSTLVPWAFVSGEMGVRKPDPEAFAAALAAVGRDAADVIFVDDSATNVEGAAAVGIESIRFEGASALRASLALKGLPLGRLTDDIVRNAALELSRESDDDDDGGGGRVRGGGVAKL